MLNSARRPQSSWTEEAELLYWRAVLNVTRELRAWRGRSSQLRQHAALVADEVRQYLWVPALAWVAGVFIGLALF